MVTPNPLTVLCLASFEKGHEFLRECKRQGCRVFLLTSLSLKDTAEWPRESIDEIFYMPDTDQVWNRADTLSAVSYLARTNIIDRIVPLDDFDLEMAAELREHLRIPGMGQTTTRYFRDKLAMRMKAAEEGLLVPEFVHVLHHETVNRFLERIPPPWVLKPRFLAGAIGIKKVNDAAEFWSFANALGDQQSSYLLERYVAGDIFHVDSIVYEREMLFCRASQYGYPPLDVAQGGGIFTSRLLPPDFEITHRLLDANREVLHGLGLLRGVSHTEFIVGRDDGRCYFLETSARVGGAHVADLVAAATGINLWAEWAKIEIAGGNAPYAPPPRHSDYAGLLVSLSRQEYPDTSAFDDPEVVWRMHKKHHIGLIVKSANYQRIEELLTRYTDRVRADFHASAPARERPTQ